MSLAPESTSKSPYPPNTTFASDVESDSDGDDDERSFAAEDMSPKKSKRVPTTLDRGNSMHVSGLGTGSSHHRSHFLRNNQSMLSIVESKQADFGDENRLIRALRYIYILSPHPNEEPIKKRIRIATWVALILDLVNALGKHDDLLFSCHHSWLFTLLM